MAGDDNSFVQGELGHRPPAVPALQLGKLPLQGQNRSGSRGANFSRPFTTSTQWPARMFVPNNYGGATERPNTREAGNSDEKHRNGIMTERSRGSYVDVIPDIRNLNFQRGSTPMALYSNIFTTPPPGSSRAGVAKPRSPDTDVFGNPISARRASNPNTSREWQKMAVRISGAVDRMEEIALLGDALQALLGRHASLHVHWNGNQPANYVDMLMAEKPTSRKQAELLSAWLEQQVEALADVLPSFSNPLATSRMSSSLAAWQTLPKTELAKRLVGQSMNQPAQTFFHNHGHSLNVEGFGLPNDSRFMRALLEVTSVAAAATIHQVAMHCHERGQLLSQVWNMHTSLMDMELAQLRFQVKVLSEEKDKFARQLNNANFYIRTGREKDGEIEELAEKVKRLNGDLAIKEQELDTSQLEVIRLQAIIESWGESGLSVDEIQEMQMEIVEMQAEKEEAEKTRDIALTALFAGVEKSITVGKGLQEIRESTFSQLGPGLRQEIDQVFGRIDADLKKITAMEDMVESKMDLSDGRMKANDTNFLMLMKAKTTAKRLKGLGKTLTSAKLKKHIEDENPLDKVESKKALKPPDIDIGNVVEDLGVSVIPEIMLEADMADVEGMNQDAMFEEIQRLRERENTLLYTLNTLLEEKNMQTEEVAPSSPQRGKTGGEQSGRGVGKGSPRARRKATKGRDVQGASGEERDSDVGSMPGSPQKERGEDDGRGGDSGGAAAGGVGSRTVGLGVDKQISSIGNRSSTFAESLIPRQDGKKDTIIMMMRALVTGRQQEVEARRMRALKTNKAAGRLSTMARQVAQEGLMKQLEERALHAEKLLAAYKHVHEEYVKLYNVMRSGSKELRGLKEPDELIAPEQLGASVAGSGDSASSKASVSPATRKKMGVAQKARKSIAAEAFAKAAGGGKGAASTGGSGGKGKSRRYSKQPTENEAAAAVVAAEAPAAEKSLKFDAPSAEGSSSGGKATAAADKTVRPKTAGNATGDDGAGGGGGDGKHLSGVLKSVRRNKTFHGADGDGDDTATAASGGKSSGASNTLGSMVMKNVRASPFACKDAALKEAMFKYKSLKPRAKDWVIRLIEKLYSGKAALDAKHIQEGEELVDMPTFLFSHLQAQYGAKSLVQEYTASIIITMRQYYSEDIRLQSFSRFLSQEWNTPVLRVFLDASERVNTYGALVKPCCEFPENYIPGRGLPGWVCTWKAMAIADVVLGRRSADCVAGFHKILAHYACPVDALERSKYFWSPGLPPNATEAEREAAAAAEEAAKGQELSKLSVPRFLDCLCEEYNRVEGLLQEVVPMLFKDHDTDFSGFLNRKEVEVMLRSLDGTGFREEELTRLWDFAVQFEEASSDEMGHEPLAGGVGVHAFLDAVRRTDAVRRYIRLYRTPPPPELMGDEHKASQSKMLYLIVERHWRSFEESVDRILEGGEVDSSESALRGQITKMSAEQDGARRAQMFVNLLKTLCDIMLVRIQRQCNPSILSNVFDPSMEPNLEKVEKAVKVLYGWKTLLEDDTKTTAAILDPNSGLVARAKAMKDWASQSRAFVEYKENMQRQAAVILQRKFARRWWVKKQRTNRFADTGSQRDILEDQSESAIPVSHIMKFLKASK